MFARLAHFGHDRARGVAIGGLIAFVVFAVLGGSAPNKLLAPRAFDDPGSASTEAREQVERATGHGAYAEVVALVKAPPASDQVTQAAQALSADPSVAHVTVPPTSGHSALVSRDGRETLLPVLLRAGVRPNSVVDRLASRFAGDRSVVLGGDLFATRQAGKQATRDLALAELIAFPLLAILSLLIFRGVGALLPISVGAMTVLGTFSALRALNAALALSPFALNLVIGLGLGLAVDYSLLFVSRFREELGKRDSTHDALRATLQSAGRTVTFSALTVAAAMASLTVFPQRFLISLGIGGALVALIAAAVTLVLLPALLTLLSRRLGRVRPAADETGRWYRLARWVMQRPALAAAGAVVLLLLVAIPATGLKWSGIDATVLPTSQTARVLSDTVTRDFASADTSPLPIVITAPAGANAALDRYASTVSRTPGVDSISAPRYLGAETWEMAAQGQGAPNSQQAQALVGRIRALPSRFRALVGGAAAALYDQHAAVSANLPPALAILAVLTLVVLWLLTGSIVLPIQALLMNALTVAAATGLVVFVFQDGNLASLLGASRQQGIEQTDYLVLVALVFGLSTDYGVFLLGRIKEAHDFGLPTADAIASGVQRTGAIVSAAAVLLAVALGAFVTGQIVFLKELGVGAAAAVLLDAFVVRALLLPASLRMIGAANWYSPRPLRRIHRKLGAREAPLVDGPRGAEARAGV